MIVCTLSPGTSASISESDDKLTAYISGHDARASMATTPAPAGPCGGVAYGTARARQRSALPEAFAMQP